MVAEPVAGYGQGMTTTLDPVRASHACVRAPGNAPGRLLSLAQRSAWLEQGYLGPFDLVTPGEMQRLRAAIDREIFIREAQRPAPERDHDRHLDQPAVWELCSHPALVERVADLIGPDLILWRSNFQDKPAGGPAVPWHQDGTYFDLQPCILVSAWIAIDEATTANGCLQIIPGSHRSLQAHRHDPTRSTFSHSLAPTPEEIGRAVSFPLAPGQCLLFNEFTTHGSGPNTTGARRLGLTPRITVPFVRIPMSGDGQPRLVSLLRGSDYTRELRLAPPPLRR